MTDVKGLKERLEAKEPVRGRIRYSTYFSGGYEFDRAVSVMPIDAGDGVLRNPDGPAALAYIADLEAKLAALDQEVERWVSSCQIAQDQAMENGGRASRAEAKLAVAREALKAVTDDLHSELIARYGDDHAHYPSIRRKFEADMEIVNNARTALNTIGEDHG